MKIKPIGHPRKRWKEGKGAFAEQWDKADRKKKKKIGLLF